jgi:hypothetical protein
MKYKLNSSGMLVADIRPFEINIPDIDEKKVPMICSFNSDNCGIGCPLFELDSIAGKNVVTLYCGGNKRVIRLEADQ